MVISPYLSRKWSDFNEIWSTDAQFDFENCQVSKFYNSSLLHISTAGKAMRLSCHINCLASSCLGINNFPSVGGRDPDGMKYINVNVKAENINVINCRVNNDM